MLPWHMTCSVGVLMNKKKKSKTSIAAAKKNLDSLLKKMPHPAVDFDRDKNEAYLPQDESVEPFDHIVDEVPNLSDEDLRERSPQNKTIER